MKITKTQLKQIIKEELDKVVGEQYRSRAHWSEQDYYIPKHRRTHGGKQVGEHGDQKEEAARAAWSQDNPGYRFPGDVRGSEPFEHGGRTYGGKGEPDPDADDDDYYTAQKQYEYDRDNPRRKPYGGHGGGDPLGFASERRPSLRNLEEDKK